MIFCDITQSYTESSGGIRTYIHEKQKYILEHTDFQHLLIVPGEKDSVSRQGRLTICKVKAPPVKGAFPFRFILRLDKVYKILQQEQPDLIELGSAYILPYAAFHYKSMFHRPVVGFYHTDFPTAYVQPAVTSRFGYSVGNFCFRLSSNYAKFIYNHCDATITSSTALFKKLQKNGIRFLEHINLGVDLQLFHPDKRDYSLRRAYGLEDHEVMFFYHGRFDTEKRIDILIDSFNSISSKIDAQLFLMGEGPQKQFVLKAAQNSHKIHVLPYENNRTTLAKHLASADIYCTAGPFETFGLSIIEAQASGLATCGVRAGALVERVPEFVGVLSTPNSVEDYAKTLFDLSQNGYLLKGANARKMVEIHFSWDNSFKKLLSLYEKLVCKYI